MNSPSTKNKNGHVLTTNYGYGLRPKRSSLLMLLKTVMTGRLKPKQLITHQFMLDDIMNAYETFGNAAKERALKVILTNK